MNEEATVDYEGNDNGQHRTHSGDGRDRGPERARFDDEGGISSYLSDDMMEAVQRARVWVIGNPFAALGIAVATGFVVGRVFRGSR